MATKEKTTEQATLGHCAYCGQSMTMDQDKGGELPTQEVADQVATAACNCEVARAARKIDERFTDQQPDGVAIVKNAANEVFQHRAAGMTYKFNDNVRATLSRTKKGKLVVKRTEAKTSTDQF